MSYRVLQKLSGGGFSDVFEVEDPASALPERLILKRLTSEMSARPEVRTAFAAEARILRELRHPNIVTFRRCYFDESGRVCLLMEKVGGEPLDAWMRRHLAKPEAVLDVFEKVLKAVDSLHHRDSPFLHLDLKPDNILVSPSPQGAQPVLIDFGIARRSGKQGLKAYTPPYAAPEQQTGGTLDCSADVHALGQILAETLEALSLPQGPVREALAAVATKAKSLSRRARFADAGEMGLAFRRARKTAASTPPARPESRVLAPRLPRWAYAAGGSALGIAILAALLWSARPSGPSPALLPDSAPAADGAAVRQQFDVLLRKAKEATRERSFDKADQYFMEAKRLSGEVPPGGEIARAMVRDLTSLRSQIDLVRLGGIEGERVRLDMQ